MPLPFTRKSRGKRVRSFSTNLTFIAMILAPAASGCLPFFSQNTLYIQRIESLSVSSENTLNFIYSNSTTQDPVVYQCRSDGASIKLIGGLLGQQSLLSNKTPKLSINLMSSSVCGPLETHDFALGPGVSQQGSANLAWSSANSTFGAYNHTIFSLTNGKYAWWIPASQLRDECVAATETNRNSDVPYLGDVAFHERRSELFFSDGFTLDTSGRVARVPTPDITANGVYLRSPVITDDGTRVFYALFTRTQGYGFLEYDVGLNQSEKVAIVEGRKPCMQTPMAWHKKSGTLVCVAHDASGENNSPVCEVSFINPESGQIRGIQTDFIPCDLDFSPDGETLYAVERSEFIQSIYSIDINSGESKKIVDATILPRKDTIIQ